MYRRSRFNLTFTVALRVVAGVPASNAACRQEQMSFKLLPRRTNTRGNLTLT